MLIPTTLGHICYLVLILSIIIAEKISWNLQPTDPLIPIF